MLRGLLLGIVLGLIAWLPLPGRRVQLPGPTWKTGPQVTVAGHPRPQDPGEFYITTIYQRPATLWWAIRGWLEPDWELVPGGDIPLSAADADPNHAMLRELAYRTCGLEARPVISVLDLTSDSPCKGKVLPGEEVLEVDGTRVEQPSDVASIVSHSKGSVHLKLTQPGSGQSRTLDVMPGPIAHLKGRRGLGLLLSHTFDTSTLPAIFFRSGNYEGSSSDLMLALDVCERLLSMNLRRGRQIAGSGSLNSDGLTTPVLGLRQKWAGARRAGASLFLVPAGAPPLPTDGPRVVQVDSLAQAIAVLRAPIAGDPQGKSDPPGKPAVATTRGRAENGPAEPAFQ